MIDLITLFDKNGKSAVYTGRNIHGTYIYLQMIGSPTIFTTSVQCSHHFGPSCSINNHTASLQPVIADFCMIQKSFCECCGRIGHNAGACIIRVPNFLPPSIIIKMNNFNALHGDEPTETTREWNSQPKAAHFKPITSPPNTSTVVSDIMGRLNQHAIDIGDAEVYP